MSFSHFYLEETIRILDNKILRFFRGEICCYINNGIENVKIENYITNFTITGKFEYIYLQFSDKNYKNWSFIKTKNRIINLKYCMAYNTSFIEFSNIKDAINCELKPFMFGTIKCNDKNILSNNYLFNNENYLILKMNKQDEELYLNCNPFRHSYFLCDFYDYKNGKFSELNRIQYQLNNKILHIKNKLKHQEDKYDFYMKQYNYIKTLKLIKCNNKSKTATAL